MGACPIRGLPDEVSDVPHSAIVWMHGLGDTEIAWGKRLTETLLPVVTAACGPCKLVAPRAPVAKVTCCNGKPTRSWFDMEELPIGAGHAPPRFGCSLDDALASARRIHRIIDELRKLGVPSQRIAVGGFSQGGAMSILSSLHYSARLACCIAFSAVLLGRDQLPSLIHPSNEGMEVLWCHGLHDVTVLPSLQRVGCEALEEAGVPVDRRSYR
eukprot:CAMPEP_0168401808 /NCGR_PEP_ID=MMETSP0228-20121227/23298_1 /TAXON_ID=133427 /ORGANISM="Protoceratium reticulatum, Strain CCCM 535 (=CCMP 1889)" /LENGTH=212 /DNA_ID=CAMNT_0008415379 /DNA_START=119 /DNA_END=754 /DNA_ORIENTATION=+